MSRATGRVTIRCQRCGRKFTTHRCHHPKFCSQACSRFGQRRGKAEETNAELYERLMRRVRKTMTTGDPLRTGCWLKMGQPSTRYPTITLRGHRAAEDKAVSCHRLMWELTHSESIPDDMMVCHTCDITNCINPHHLFLGTCLENQQDMTRKGRGRTGSRNGATKLTDADVEAICRDYIKQDKSHTASSVVLGVRYGVTPTTIQRVVRGQAVSNDIWPATEKVANGRRWLYCYNGEAKSLTEWSRDVRCVVSYRCLKLRVWYGWTFAKALLSPLLTESQ